MKYLLEASIQLSRRKILVQAIQITVLKLMVMLAVLKLMMMPAVQKLMVIIPEQSSVPFYCESLALN